MSEVLRQVTSIKRGHKSIFFFSLLPPGGIKNIPDVNLMWYFIIFETVVITSYIFMRPESCELMFVCTFWQPGADFMNMFTSHSTSLSLGYKPYGSINFDSRTSASGVLGLSFKHSLFFFGSRSRAPLQL